MTQLVVPANSYGLPEGSSNFEDVFAYWNAYWSTRDGGWMDGYPGIVDYEKGRIAGGSSKPSFPTKGIYPNKNMEKSRLFYGVRGVRRTDALFTNRVNGKYPRVILTHRMMTRDTGATRGIFYLAKVDNYDGIEWYRTLNGGLNWHIVRYDGLYLTEANGGYIANPYPQFTESKTAYGSLPSDVLIPPIVDKAAMKCRVYKGKVWTESDIIYANGTIEKNSNPKLTPPTISVEIEHTENAYAVKELMPPAITLSIETDTKFTRTEEEEPFFVTVSAKTESETRAYTLEKLEGDYAVKELMPPAITLSIETDTKFTRTEELIPLIVAVSTETTSELLTFVLEKLEGAYGVDVLRPPLIELEIEMENMITRNEVLV